MPQFESHFFSSLIFWEILSFGILFFLLYKYAFPSLLGMLEEREKKIKDSLDQAERHRSEAERKLREYEAKLATAAKDAEALLTQAKERAQRLMEENEQRMTVDAERIKGDATREIEQERRKAIQDIRSQTTDLALMVAEKVVGRALTEADHRRLGGRSLGRPLQDLPKPKLVALRRGGETDASLAVSFQIQGDESVARLFQGCGQPFTPTGAWIKSGSSSIASSILAMSP